MSSDSPKTRTVDVRPVIARGEEPFPRIMAAVAALGPNDRLTLITPFLPSPLIEKLQSEGFDTRPERRADGGWQTQIVSATRS
jgi:uncharacterized protein (DUF2249 family)